MNLMDKRELICNTCHRAIDETIEEWCCFGDYEDGKKVWCREHWQDLQQWRREKFMNEDMKRLLENCDALAKDLEKDRESTIELLKTVERLRNKLERAKTPQDIDDTPKIERQGTL